MNKTTTLPLPERLKNGARKLGEFWKKEEERCPSGWSLEVCSCQPMKKFCQARVLWLTLAVEAGRDLQEEPFGLALAMMASEFDATGLGLKIEHPQIGEFLAGTKPGCVITLKDLAKLMDSPEVLSSALRVMKFFPRSSIEGLMEMVLAGVVSEANPDEAFE